MSSTTTSCLLIEDKPISHTRTIDFEDNHNDVIELFDDLREDHTIHELQIFGLSECDRNLLVRFSMALRSYPAIQKLTFKNSFVQHLGPVFVAIAREPLVALEFYRCDIYEEATEDLNILLESSKIRELRIDSCQFADAVQDILAGIRKNRSLQAFEIKGQNFSAEFMSSIAMMLKNNRNMEYLSVTDVEITHDQACRLLRSIESGQSLKRFQFSHRISLSLVERIVLMFWETPTLREVDFTGCSFHADALKYLLNALSKRTRMDSVNLSYANIESATKNTWLKISQDVALVKVKRLVLTCERLNFRSILPQVARAGFVQHLDFKDYIGELNGICGLLRDHPGPIELILDSYRDFQPHSISADDHHTGLKSITCRILRTIDLVNVARQAEHMRGLRKLTLKTVRHDRFTPEFFSALSSSLLANHSLCHLSLPSNLPINDAIRKNLVQIRQALAINRVGGLPFLHHANQVPLGLWARVLSRSTWDPDGIYFVVREKPDIIRPQMQVMDEGAVPGTASDSDEVTNRATKRARST